MEVNHPLLYLIVNCCVLEELGKVCGDYLLWSCLFTLLVPSRTFHFRTARTRQSISKRESVQLLLDSADRREDRRQLLFHLLRTPLTVLMQILPILLQNILDVLQQLHQLIDDVALRTGGTGWRFLRLNSMQKTTLIRISIAQLPFFLAVLAIFRSFLTFLLREEELPRWRKLLFLICCKHDYKYLFL